MTWDFYGDPHGELWGCPGIVTGRFLEKGGWGAGGGKWQVCQSVKGGTPETKIGEVQKSNPGASNFQAQKISKISIHVLVIQHNHGKYGKSPFLMGISTINGHFSIAILN